MKLLLDTNVLLDCYQKREPFYQDWKKLTLMRYFRDVELWVSAKSFTDVHYVTSRQLDSLIVQDHILKSLTYLDICSIDAHDVKNALEERWRDFEDCLIYQAARKVKADYIITRNKKDFSQSSIPVLTPAEFVRYMDEERHTTYYEMER